MKYRISDLWEEPVESGIFPPLRQTGNDVIDTISEIYREKKNCHVYDVGMALKIQYIEVESVVKSLTGLRPAEWIRRLKFMDASWLLLHTAMDTDRIADELGYSSVQTFNYFFRKHTGLRPKDYRDRYVRVEIKTEKIILHDPRLDSI